MIFNGKKKRTKNCEEIIQTNVLDLLLWEGKEHYLYKINDPDDAFNTPQAT